jgi:predicted alpha/beta hydrolase
MEIIQLKTSDQYDISITHFEPKFGAKKLLINSATGVKQQTYYDFAQYFADNGYTVITYDYRGISLSNPKNERLQS